MINLIYLIDFYHPSQRLGAAVGALRAALVSYSLCLMVSAPPLPETRPAGLYPAEVLVQRQRCGANVLLTLVSRSRRYTLRTTWHYLNPMLPAILSASLLLLALYLLVPGPQHLFQLQTITLVQLAACFGVAAVSTGWFESYKALRGSARSAAA